MQGIFYCDDHIKYLDLQNFEGYSINELNYAFGYCIFREEIKLQGCINVIEDFAFYGCTNLHLVENINLVQYVENEAFRNCPLINY